MEINCIIPSLNRACQLDLLLRSIGKNLSSVCGHWTFTVIYNASDEEFQKGYDLAREKYNGPDIIFYKQQDFAADIKYFLGQHKHTIFFTDDCVVFRAPTSDTNAILDDSVWDVSLRLGKNITVQNYANGEPHPPLDRYGLERNDDWLKWNWKVGNPYYNQFYEFSWDGHLYRSADILKRLEGRTFKNPREMESLIVQDVKGRQENPRKYRVSPAQSCLVVLTVNCVQHPPIPAGLFYSYSPENLNNLFVNGETIDLEAIERYTNIESSHIELPLSFRKN